MTISAVEAYQYYRKTGLGKNGVKGSTFVNDKKIKEWKNVEVKPRPKWDPILNKKWQREKDSLVRDFDRILQNMNNKWKGKKSGRMKYLFEPYKYQTLTYPCSNPEITSLKNVTREIVNPEIVKHEILDQEMVNPENNANYQILKVERYNIEEIDS